MKTPPTSPEFARFAAAMKDVLKVSPKEIQKLEAVHKESGKRLSKGSACLSPAASKLIQDNFSQR
jgi:hypothetical protein